jgi:hypothetical protein
MRINWVGVVIATLIVAILRCLWVAHLGGADWSHLLQKAISGVRDNDMAALMTLANSLVVSIGLGWLVGRMRDRSLQTGLAVGVGAAVFFAVTTAAAGYAAGGVVAGPALHAFLMDSAFYLVAYAIGGATIGAIAAK